MNKTELMVVMIRNGDTGKTLSQFLDIDHATFSLKLNGEKAQFNQHEIMKMKTKYNLTPEQIDKIFFST